HTFDMSIKLNWEATRSYVKRLCIAIPNTGTVILELDGVMLKQRDIHYLGNGKYAYHLFIEEIMQSADIQFITLLNYPRPQEQCIFLSKFSLQSVYSPMPVSHRWLELRSDLNKFGGLLDAAQDYLDWDGAAKVLQSTLDKYGLTGTSVVTKYSDEWNAVFEQTSGALTEVHSLYKVCSEDVLTARTIRILEVHVRSLQFDKDFFDAVRSNDSLLELSVSYLGHNILYYTGHIAKMWHASARPIRLTMLDHMEVVHDRVVAQLAIRGRDSQFKGSSVLDRDAAQALDVPFLDIEFQQWDCDHVFSPLSDYSASFLDVATNQHPSVLTMFTLEVSQLSCHSLASVQKILYRSSLEHLVIMCTPFELDLSNSIAQVLGAISWPTLKSLVLSGVNLNEWVDIWPFATAPQLQCLQIQTASNSFHGLSHSSVLFVHRLLSTSQQAELHLMDVQLQDKRDYVLLAESMNCFSIAW
ncbi:hypothetical protein BGZ82_002587, partial [Podila clonocystis]